MSDPRVLIMMGSESDFDTMKPCVDVLEEYGVANEVVVASAHRTPHVVERLAREAEARGIKVIICAAGMSAHLAGVVAAYTILPVIGVPMEAAALKGVDALYSIVQMPGGIPVACMGIGKHGAKNAGYLAAQIIALMDPELRDKLFRYRDELSDTVAAMNRRVQDKLGR
ncbi:MAG: 5-(carboxyamino)imidazole ribonucleotide mutase [Planctomycetes bacterium]|nr:5-(carboxyamino)imidazole ribonucleotide mutase [Planctomycetota bacterium]